MEYYVSYLLVKLGIGIYAEKYLAQFKVHFSVSARPMLTL